MDLLRVALAAITGAISGLYDKYLMKVSESDAGANPGIMFIRCLLCVSFCCCFGAGPKRKSRSPVSLGLDDYPDLHFPFCCDFGFTFTHLNSTID